MPRDDDHLRVSLMNSANSDASVHPDERDAADNPPAPRKLSAAERQRSQSTSADSFNHQLYSSSALQREHSRSRTGATILNVPLSTQTPSKLISKAGERVRAYSDSLERDNLPLGRQQSDSSNMLQVAPGKAALSSHSEAHEDAHHAATVAAVAASYSPTQTPHSHKRDSLPYLEPGVSPVNLIAFVNFNSGGKTGRRSASVLMQEIGKDNVYNLDGANPTRDLEKHLRTPNLRIAVCGGDGTVNWVLSCQLTAHICATCKQSGATSSIDTSADTNCVCYGLSQALLLSPSTHYPPSASSRSAPATTQRARSAGAISSLARRA